MRNRWGVEIKKGHFVRYRGGRDGTDDGSGFVANIDTRSDYAKAYGTLLTVAERDGSMPMKVSIDAVYESLGPMKVGRDFVVTQNPLTRIKKSKIKTQPSQLTGLDPDERLIKRRRKTAAQPMRGVYANPLTRVTVTSPSQRFHEGIDGPTDSPTARLRQRRKTTKRAPAGFYANPKAAPYRSVEMREREGLKFGLDSVTPVPWTFTTLARATKGTQYSYKLPAEAVASPDFQAWARGNGGRVICSLSELRKRIKSFM